MLDFWIFVQANWSFCIYWAESDDLCMIVLMWCSWCCCKWLWCMNEFAYILWCWFVVAELGKVMCGPFALFGMKGHTLINEFLSMWILACMLMWVHLIVGYILIDIDHEDWCDWRIIFIMNFWCWMGDELSERIGWFWCHVSGWVF